MIKWWLIYFIFLLNQPRYCFIIINQMNKNLLVGLIALLCVGAVLYNQQSTQQPDAFESWKAEFGSHWSPSQETYRRMVFMNNLEKVIKHNADKTQTYQMGINQFSALTQSEFFMTVLAPKPYNPEWETAVEQNIQNLKADIDWTTQGKVSPVKNQGNCGSCWAFSAVGVLQAWALFNGKTVNLSEQQLVDCSKAYGNQGCNGGFNYQGLAYVKDHGITDTNSYPYAAKTQTCKMDGGSFKISSVPTAKGCTAMLEALKGRPIGVSVDATNWSPYKSGVFNNCKANLNHDVLLVGATDTFWKIKNSWSTSWGQNGFIRLASGNTCGVCVDKSPWVA